MHFDDYTHYLRDLKYSQEWSIDQLAQTPTQVDCGDMVASFQYRQGGELDSDLFSIESDTLSNTFNVLFSLDESKVQQYEITYSVQYEGDARTSVTSQEFFEIDIVDKCDEPAGISAPILQNQEYTVTGDTERYKI